MKSWDKIKHMPKWVKVLLSILVIMLVVITVLYPYWLELVFYVVLMGLFCPHYNFLSTNCGSNPASDAFGWLVLAVGGFILYLIIKKIHIMWKNL